MLRGIVVQSKCMKQLSESGPVHSQRTISVILPALDRCDICRQAKGGCDQKIVYDYRRDNLRPEWQGWHAFRRGFATNLHRLGVNDKTIQAILRHSNIATTQKIYIKTVSSDSEAAMKLLEIALCANCAPAPTPTAHRMLN